MVPERVGAFLKNVKSEEHVAEMSIPKNTCSANLAMNAGAAAAMKKVSYVMWPDVTALREV